jgi:hypothetical protein
MTQYKGKYNEFHDNETNKSELYNSMFECSPKMISVIFNIFKSKGPVLVYSNYVEMEGIEIFKIYLQFFGFVNYVDDKELNMKDHDKKYSKDGFRYVEYHGGIAKPVRETNKKAYNLSENKHGKIIKIIMISPAGSEGISLANTRQVHIMEPYWNEVRIEQIIGRAIRQCSHKDLPMSERKVDVFRYKMVRRNEKETTDQRMEGIARKKMNLIQSFLEAVRESAVDCKLFENHNMMGTEYKCFQFNENSQLEKPIGPAYRKDIEQELKVDNGPYAVGNQRMKIKVRKIKAVKKIDENSYSESLYFWYYNVNGMVYDYDMHFPIGRISKDESGNPSKLDNETYIIDHVIDIPILKNIL